MQQPAGHPLAPARARARWGTITREQLVLAAKAEIEAGRYEQMTIRLLASRLGVAPMSLYRHVQDKEDLLNEVVDRMLAEIWQPKVDASDPWAWLAEAADRFRTFLVEQPAALHVFLSRPVTSPAAKARMRGILDVMEAAGLDEPAARRLYAATLTYILGFAALEASRARWLAAHDEIADPDEAWLAAMTGSQQFSDGLAALYDGARRSIGLAER
jgi:TetR/AcrR family transcriptional regulator, tetracycline repressor protein